MTDAILNPRSVHNIGFAQGAGEYHFINHYLCCEQGGLGSGWTTGTTFPQAIGPNGHPNSQLLVAAGKTFGGGVRIPSSSQFGATGSGQYYVLRWKGSSQVFFGLNSPGSITLNVGLSTNVTQINGYTYRTTAATVDTKMVFSYDGLAQIFALSFLGNDLDGVGATGNVRNVAWYRLDDEADYLAGKIFRTSFKKNLISMNPGAIRFMDWCGGNDSKLTRFDTSRCIPGQEYFGYNYTSSPAYGETTGTNQYVLATATGTAGNSQATPANHIHGEIVTCRVGSAMVRAGQKTVSTISNANPGQVTCTGHGFNTGDVVIHALANGVMPKLNLFPVTVTVLNANTYTVGIDTSTFGAYSGSGTVNQYITLNVGGRGAYPVTYPDGSTPASTYGSGYIAALDYKTFIFDKALSAQNDSNGNPVYGVWTFNDLGSNNAHQGGVPIEYCVALINELNAMNPKYTINMWLNIPHRGISSMDNYTLAPPYAYTTGAGDYTAASNYGVNLVNVVLNGANGMAGLGFGAGLLLEYSNETWNSGGNAFSQTYYLAKRGSLRWPASGTADYASMVALRSVIAMEDIKASAYYDATRIRCVLSGQGALGVSGLNTGRIDGTTYFLNDPLNTWGNTVAPMAHHDYFAFAAYFTASDTWIATNVPIYASNWVIHNGNPVLQEADCAAYLQGTMFSASGGSQAVDSYTALIPTYAAKLATYSKSVVMYEGGWDQNVSPFTDNSVVTASLWYCPGVLVLGTNTITSCPVGYVTAVAAAILSDTMFVYGYGIPDGTTVTAASGTTITLSNNATVSVPVASFVCYTSQQAFLRACQRSRTWAVAQTGFFNSIKSSANVGLPSMYVEVSSRWGRIFPTSYGFSNIEWSDVDLCWQYSSLRNSRKRRILINNGISYPAAIISTLDFSVINNSQYISLIIGA